MSRKPSGSLSAAWRASGPRRPRRPPVQTRGALAAPPGGGAAGGDGGVRPGRPPPGLVPGGPRRGVRRGADGGRGPPAPPGAVPGGPVGAHGELSRRRDRWYRGRGASVAVARQRERCPTEPNPMTESEWLTSEDPAPMLAAVAE